MTRQEAINSIYSFLKDNGKVRHKKDFAQKINFDYAGVSSALHGNPRYLTDGLFSKINATFPEAFRKFPADDYVGSNSTSSNTLDKSRPSNKGSERHVSTDTPARISASSPSSVYNQSNIELLRLLKGQQELLAKSQEQTEMALRMVGYLSEEIKKMNTLIFTKLFPDKVE